MRAIAFVILLLVLVAVVSGALISLPPPEPDLVTVHGGYSPVTGECLLDVSIHFKNNVDRVVLETVDGYWVYKYSQNQTIDVRRGSSIFVYRVDFRQSFFDTTSVDKVVDGYMTNSCTVEEI